MDKVWYIDLLRNILGMLDYTIFSLIQWITQGIFDIASLNVSSDLFEDVTGKIYIFLGIFMLFKISISLLKYIVSPDAIFDKEKGVGKLVAKTVGAVVLLIMLPTIFGLLREAQSVFLPVLPKVLFNETDTIDSNDVSSTIEETSNAISVLVLKTFFRPYYETAEDGTISYYAQEITSLNDFKNNITSGHGGRFGFGDQYNYEYVLFVPTIIGIVLVAVLLSITISIGVRVFKLIILELIAPIPVLSLIDIKSTKDSAFSAWTKQLISTFLDIFVKLGIIYIVLFFLKRLGEDSLFMDYGAAGAEGGIRMGYLRILLIIALLKFAKDAPKFIKESIGIKDKGDSAGILGAIGGGILGAGTGLISGAISGRGFRGAITGATAGFSNGFSSGMQGKKGAAWRTAGDAALQARTGNKDAKSGVLAMLQASTSKAQKRSAAKSLGLTKATLDKNESLMYSLKDTAGKKKMYFDSIMQQGPLVGETQADYELRRDTAYDDWREAEMHAATAEANFNKADKAFGEFGLKTSFSQKYDTSITHRAKRNISQGYESTVDKITSTFGGSTVADRRRDRRDKIISKSRDKGGYDADLQ